MKIEKCTHEDINRILALHEAARNLQIAKNMVVWPVFEASFVAKEIDEGRQWKIIIDDEMACNWAITFEDKEIWEEMDQNDAIYIHRICTEPKHRGNRFIDAVVSWAKHEAIAKEKKYIRLDTLGNNSKLIAHYQSAGFTFLGMSTLTNTSNLPKHYQDYPYCCRFELEV